MICVSNRVTEGIEGSGRTNPKPHQEPSISSSPLSVPTNKSFFPLRISYYVTQALSSTRSIKGTHEQPDSNERLQRFLHPRLLRQLRRGRRTRCHWECDWEYRQQGTRASSSPCFIPLACNIYLAAATVESRSLPSPRFSLPTY